jgi:hypothetical protein
MDATTGDAGWIGCDEAVRLHAADHHNNLIDDLRRFDGEINLPGRCPRSLSELYKRSSR